MSTWCWWHWDFQGQWEEREDQIWAAEEKRFIEPKDTSTKLEKVKKTIPKIYRNIRTKEEKKENWDSLVTSTFFNNRILSSSSQSLNTKTTTKMQTKQY